MAEESGPSPFDVRTVRDLVGLMSRHDLAELELADGTRSIKLKRAIAAPMPILTVQVGSKVGPGTIVCIIEAMKIFNEIPADLTGTIVEVCVESKQPVEYGQVLFRIDPAA